MTKTHSRAKLCKQKLPTPHRALLKHLKENTRWQSASAQRMNSPVKRLFTTVHSLRLKPLDSGEVCFFLLLLSCRKMSFYKAGKTSLAASEDKLESSSRCLVRRCSSPARPDVLMSPGWLEADALREQFVSSGDILLGKVKSDAMCNQKRPKCSGVSPKFAVDPLDMNGTSLSEFPMRPEPQNFTCLYIYIHLQVVPCLLDED